MTADGHACVCARTTHRPKILIFVTACGNRVSGEAAFANCSLGTTVEHRLLACAPSGHAIRSFPSAGSKPAGHTDWKSMFRRGLIANKKVRDPEKHSGSPSRRGALYPTVNRDARRKTDNGNARVIVMTVFIASPGITNGLSRSIASRPTRTTFSTGTWKKSGPDFFERDSRSATCP